MPVITLVTVAVMAALLAVCAWLTVPAAVPFTMQTFGVFLALKLLGGKKGTLAVLVYILLGASGLPVFSSFKGGMGALAGPTGGYIMGFLLTGLLYWGLERFMKNARLEDAVLFAGLLVCYLFGTVWFMHVMSSNGKPYTFLEGLSLCVLPYLFPDLIKLILADFLSRRLKKVLRDRI
ncbi:MAG: biotin transporter BioY [Lachnospiraceae bacterium]|nr:biotin transporter BioY [Lachnospiraceae bacterium]